jgi:hypothetical protein
MVRALMPLSLQVSQKPLQDDTPTTRLRLNRSARRRLASQRDPKLPRLNNNQTLDFSAVPRDLQLR